MEKASKQWKIRVCFHGQLSGFKYCTYVGFDVYFLICSVLFVT